MRRRVVEVEVAFLAILAVVSLVAGKAEQALLQKRVAAIPQRHGEADLLVTVANSRDPVLVPAVCASIARGRAARVPRRRRSDCSLPAPFPTRVRSGMVPSASSACFGSAILRVFVLQQSQQYPPGARKTRNSGTWNAIMFNPIILTSHERSRLYAQMLPSFLGKLN